MANKYKLKNQPTAADVKGKSKKTVAFLLLVSLIAFLTIYFSLVKIGFLAVVYIYWGLFIVLSVSYGIFARALATAKIENADDKDKIAKYERRIKGTIILLLPVIISLLADYMILSLGLAKYLGI